MGGSPKINSFPDTLAFGNRRAQGTGSARTQWVVFFRIEGNKAIRRGRGFPLSEQCRTRFGRYAVPMDDLEAVDYVDEVLGSNVKSGYNCFYAGVSNTWLCFANPRDPGTTADRFFHFD